jgi:hypothetical protein
MAPVDSTPVDRYSKGSRKSIREIESEEKYLPFQIQQAEELQVVKMKGTFDLLMLQNSMAKDYFNLAETEDEKIRRKRLFENTLETNINIVTDMQRLIFYF